MIVDALQNKSTEFDSLSSDSSCPEIATAIENSNLRDKFDQGIVTQISNNVNVKVTLGYKPNVIYAFSEPLILGSSNANIKWIYDVNTNSSKFLGYAGWRTINIADTSSEVGSTNQQLFITDDGFELSYQWFEG